MSEARPNRFPIGRGRKADAEIKQRELDRYVAQAPDESEYNVIDSGLDLKTRTSSIPFRESFKKVLPEKCPSLRAYIEDELAPRKGEAVGIEFGGIGAAAFSEFSPGFFKKSFGVALFDHRPAFVHDFKDIRTIRARDAQYGHRVLEGNILKDDTYKRLEVLLKGEKADLIIERMVRGIESLPTDPILIGNIFQRWYKLLNNGGIMLVEIPSFVEPLFTEWLSTAQDELKDSVELTADLSGRSFLFPVTLRLKKGEGAPEELPLFSAKYVKQWGIPY